MKERRSDWSDARNFAVDLGVRTRAFLFLGISDATLDATPFIDNRIDAPLDRATRIPVDDIPVESLPAGPIGWLWHTSFCGSSLLARALHVPAAQVSLKEPLVLRRLGDARDTGFDLVDTVHGSVRLLARPWHPGGGVLVKPTHAALNVAWECMQVIPGARGVLLHSELEDFLISNIKKTQETQGRIGLLAERALRATSLFARLPPEASSPPDFLCAAALQWAAQRELVVDLQDRLGAARLRTLAAAHLYANVRDVALAVQDWLRLPASREDVEARASTVAGHNAKAFEARYDNAQRERDKKLLTDRYGPLIGGALKWSERVLLPHMRPAAIALEGTLDSWT